MNIEFIHSMVQAMYRYESHQYGNPDLLTDSERQDFYCCYCGI